MSKVIKGSPFDKAGYTEDTKFKVIEGYETFDVGDIVTLYEDDGTDCPEFCTEDGRVEYMIISSEGGSDLEVYEVPSIEEATEALKKFKEEIKTVHKNKEPFVIPAAEPYIPPAKLSLLARIILSEYNLCNGHSQVTINSKLTLDDLTELMAELDNHFEKKSIASYVEARFDIDGNGSLYAVGYWDEGEHSLGHKDKLLLSWED